MRLTALAAASLLLLTAALPTQAADPASGTLTTSSEPLVYTAGPFFVANVTATGGEAVCGGDGATCDEFELTVTLPDNYDITNPDDQVEVSIAWPEPTADFDVYVYNEAGSEVGVSAGSADPEVARFPAGKGTQKYTVVVVPFAPLAQSFEGTIQLKAGATSGGGGGGGSGPVLPPAASGLPPRFITYVSPPGLADGAGEPTMGWNRVTQRAMFIAGTETDRVTFPDFLSPALPQACEAQWEDVTDLASSATTVDPILETEQTSGRTFVSNQFVGPNALFAYTDNDGESWTSASASPPNGGADHQTIGVGPYPAGSPFALAFDYAVYFCSQTLSAGAFCSRSDTGGASFGAGTPVRTPAECGTAGGIHGHLQVAPDGTAYLPLRTCTKPDGGSSQAISVSEDAGVTWVVRYIPGSEAAQKDPAVGIASDGTMYACYEAPDHSAHAVVSKDKGATWSKDYNLSARVGAKTVRFVTATAGDPDRAGCAFIATPTAGNSEALDFPGFWYGYVATTYDGGDTWHTVNTTGEDPLQGSGGVCVSGASCTGNNRNLLDFNDLIKDERGMMMFAYADGCIGDCPRDPKINSFSDNGVIARQSGGRGLLAEFDDMPLAAPKNACLAGTRTTASSKLSWRAPDNGGQEISNYQVYRSTDPAVPGSFIADAGPKLAFEDRTADPNIEKYYYTVIAQNPVGSSIDSNKVELIVAPEAPVESPCIVPGVTVLTDPAGDATNMLASYDISSISVAEPDNLPGKLVFTMKVASLATLPPNTLWAIRFIAPTAPANGDEAYFVGMHTQGGAATYVYGTSFVQDATATSVTAYQIDGEIDAASIFAADGTITLVADKALFGPLAAGDALAQFTGTTRPITQTASPIAAGAQDTATPGSYLLRAENLCALNTAPLALLTASITEGTTPLVVKFTVSGSDADNEALDSFTLSYGDGETVSDQKFDGRGMVEFTHTYTQQGLYGAKLTVTDARGLVSSNTDMKMIEVRAATVPGGGTPPVIGAPPAGASPATTTEPGRFGGSLGLLMLPLLLLGLSRRRHRH
ncbi:MAG: PKD domain-containing protein [Pseudomonadota bacterium]